MKTYERISINSNYTRRQQAVYDVCNELGLEAFRPDYHGKKGDGGTMLIYTKDTGNGIKQICYFESTDVNGNIDFGFLNRGDIDLRRLTDFTTVIKNYITARM